MKKVAIVTDTSSGITPEEAKAMGCFAIAMPFVIDGEEYLEGVNLAKEKFYQKQSSGSKISTSQPNINEIVKFWKEILKDYDEIVHIPISSALSQSCETATAFAEQFGGRVQVANNRRVSITMKRSVYDAVKMAQEGHDAKEIKKWLEETAEISSIYLVVDTLKYLKAGGRVTPAAAAVGTVLNIKPVLQIQGGKLDSFAKVTSIKKAKIKMNDALKKDLEGRFAQYVREGRMHISIAHTNNMVLAEEYKNELRQLFPNIEIDYCDELSFVIATHTGPNVLACACSIVW